MPDYVMWINSKQNHIQWYSIIKFLQLYEQLKRQVSKS
jgi:hypothetical protein